MKVSKIALRTARQLLNATVVNGAIDSERAKAFVKKVGEKKPRGYLQVLTAYENLVRLELDKRHATVESASELGADLQSSVMADLRKKYGKDLTFDFQTNPDLLGGMRVKVGSDVWDGSVRARLQQLEDTFS
tara:strand:- start:8443 stop:8838 length:396 start_codon:yes stop_codon:yes gene_type:complete